MSAKARVAGEPIAILSDEGDALVQELPTPPGYPPAFDRGLDKQIDAVARTIGLEMRVQPDVQRWEYIAIIWRDRGDVLRTTVKRGEARSADPALVWGEIRWTASARIVSLVHSHPMDQQVGSVAAPLWIRLPRADLPSGKDFDTLLEYSGLRADFDPRKNGFDPANYRSYIVTKERISKYYGFEQPASFYHAGAQATWAVRATDF